VRVLTDVCAARWLATACGGGGEEQHLGPTAEFNQAQFQEMVMAKPKP